MAGSNESVEQITSACAIATQALEAIGNLQCRDIRNLASSTATGSVSSSCNPSTIKAEVLRLQPSLEEDFQHLTHVGGEQIAENVVPVPRTTRHHLDRSHQNLGDL